MKVIVLAAGYATRLYPLTLNKPKALLTVGHQTILDFIVDEIETIDVVNEIIIVSNHKFYQQFLDWSKVCQSSIPITVLDDQTTDDSNKLGAVGDIAYAIEQKQVDEDVLVMVGDNIFTFRLKDYYDAYQKRNADMILVTRMEEIADLRRMANVIVDEDNRVIGMEEKPQQPKSNIAAFASYFYQKETLPLIKTYLEEGNNPDAPGYFPSWLYKQKPVYAYWFEGECYDIGTPESYEEINERMKRK